jgi:hypothetical protein
MNTAEDHIVKARHNANFLALIPLTDDQFADWATVVLFYRALHLLSAALHVLRRDHGNSHARRNAAVQSAFPRTVSLSYDRLYSRSRLVRYNQMSSTLAEYQRLFDNDFSPILSEVQKHLPAAV